MLYQASEKNREVERIVQEKERERRRKVCKREKEGGGYRIKRKVVLSEMRKKSEPVEEVGQEIEKGKGKKSKKKKVIMEKTGKLWIVQEME